MDNTPREQLLAILVDIYAVLTTKGYQHLPDAHYGICYQIHMYSMYEEYSPAHANRLSQLFADIAQTWPKYSGGYEFPVPGAKGSIYAKHLPGIVFTVCTLPEEKWDKDNYPYAALRWELLEFVINQLKRELNIQEQETNA
jgi:hypothetical protein